MPDFITALNALLIVVPLPIYYVPLLEGHTGANFEPTTDKI
jgi:hypothetical protein